MRANEVSVIYFSYVTLSGAEQDGAICSHQRADHTNFGDIPSLSEEDHTSAVPPSENSILIGQVHG